MDKIKTTMTNYLSGKTTIGNKQVSNKIVLAVASTVGAIVTGGAIIGVWTNKHPGEE